MSSFRTYSAHASTPILAGLVVRAATLQGMLSRNFSARVQWSVVVLLGACSASRSAPVALVEQASPAAPDAAPKAHVDIDAATPAVTGDDPPSGESVVESAEITAPGGLRVQVSWMTMTGTMHYAETLSFTTPTGTLELRGDDVVEKGPDESDPLRAEALPLVGRVDAIGGQRWVALGWSSPGEGMQTVSAWVVEDGPGGPRVVDSLAWFTDRVHAGFAIDTKTGAIGVPLPAGELHNGSDWHLRHGSEEIPLARVRKMRAFATPLAKVRDVYGPPMDVAPKEREWSGRFVWFDVAKRFERRE